MLRSRRGFHATGDQLSAKNRFPNFADFDKNLAFNVPLTGYLISSKSIS